MNADAVFFIIHLLFHFLSASASQWACRPVRTSPSTQITPPGEMWRGRPAAPGWRKSLTLMHTSPDPSIPRLSLSVLDVVQAALLASVLQWSELKQLSVMHWGAALGRQYASFWRNLNENGHGLSGRGKCWHVVVGSFIFKVYEMTFHLNETEVYFCFPRKSWNLTNATLDLCILGLNKCEILFFALNLY